MIKVIHIPANYPIKWITVCFRIQIFNIRIALSSITHEMKWMTIYNYDEIQKVRSFTQHIFMKEQLNLKTFLLKYLSEHSAQQQASSN